MAAQPGHVQNLSSICTFSFLISIKINIDHNLFYPGIRNEPVSSQAWPCCDYNSSVNVSQFAFKINFSSIDQSLQEVWAEPVA